MAFYKNSIQTNVGKILENRVRNGEGTLEFTLIKTGSGQYTSDEEGNIRDAVDLKAARQSFPFSNIKLEHDRDFLSLESVIKNENLEEGYYLTEIGIFARLAGGGEEAVLYCIGLVDEPDYIPPYTNGKVYEIVLQTLIKCCDAEHVTIQYEDNTFATARALMDHILDKENIHKVTKEQVGLGNVPNVSTNDQTPSFEQAAARENIESGEKLSAIMGKIKRWFADLKPVAFTGKYNDLTDVPKLVKNYNYNLATLDSSLSAQSTLAELYEACRHKGYSVSVYVSKSQTPNLGLPSEGYFILTVDAAWRGALMLRRCDADGLWVMGTAGGGADSAPTGTWTAVYTDANKPNCTLDYYNTGLETRMAYSQASLYGSEVNYFAAWDKNSPVGAIELKAISPLQSRIRMSALGCVTKHNYPGMTMPDGSDGAGSWIRTPYEGLLPYESGGAGSGHSSLGSDTWYYKKAYIDAVYGTHFGPLHLTSDNDYIGRSDGSSMLIGMLKNAKQFVLCPDGWSTADALKSALYFGGTDAVKYIFPRSGGTGWDITGFRNIRADTVQAGNATISNSRISFYSSGHKIHAPYGNLLYFYSNVFNSSATVTEHNGMCMAEYNDNSCYWYPIKDNTTYLGASDHRWKQVFAATSTISTSDERRKRNIQLLDESLTEAFIMGLNPISYIMADGDSGRTHYGMGAQSVERLMTDLGMTSMDFAGFIKSPKTLDVEIEEEVDVCKDVEVTDEDGAVHTEKQMAKEIRKRMEQEIVPGEYEYGLRYEEFIAPVIRFCQVLHDRADKQQEEVADLKEQSRRQQEEMENLKAENQELKERMDRLESVLGISS